MEEKQPHIQQGGREHQPEAHQTEGNTSTSPATAGCVCVYFQGASGACVGVCACELGEVGSVAGDGCEH